MQRHGKGPSCSGVRVRSCKPGDGGAALEDVISRAFVGVLYIRQGKRLRNTSSTHQHPSTTPQAIPPPTPEKMAQTGTRACHIPRCIRSCTSVRHAVVVADKPHTLCQHLQFTALVLAKLPAHGPERRHDDLMRDKATHASDNAALSSGTS